MMTYLRITFLGCWVALALSGCGMTEPVGMSDLGQHASGDVVAQDGALASQQDGEKQDRAALTALYESTNGANWKDNTNWLTDVPLNKWYGVSTDGQDRVTVLYLRENNLTGAIPPELRSHL